MNYKLGLYEKAMPPGLLWPEMLASAKAAGFDFLELSIDESDGRLERLDYPAPRINEMRRAAEGEGLPVSSMCLSGHRRYPLGSHDPGVRRRSLDILRKALDLSCALGIRIIQLAGYDVYYEESDSLTRGYFSENIQKCAELAAQNRLLLGFETMETPFMDTVEKAMKYVLQVNSPYLQIYPDIGNLTNASKLYGHSVEDDLELGRGHIVSAHLKESLPGRYREVPFGTGHVAFAAAVRKCMDLGVCSFVAEFWHAEEENWRRGLIDAAGFARSQLPDGGVRSNA